MSKFKIDFNDDITTFNGIISALGGKRRMEILKLIGDGRDWTITAIAKRLNCKISNVSQQIKILEDAGLIVKRLAKTIGNTSKIIKPIYNEIIIKL